MASVPSRAASEPRRRASSKSPSRSPSPLRRELPASLRLGLEEVRHYDTRSPALHVRKKGQFGPVRSPNKAQKAQDSLRSSDTVHPRRVTLEPVVAATGKGQSLESGPDRTASPGRDVAPGARKKMWGQRRKGTSKGKAKDSQKGRGKSMSKGGGKSKAKTTK